MFGYRLKKKTGEQSVLSLTSERNQINAAPKALSEKLSKQLKDELFMFLSRSLVKKKKKIDCHVILDL